VPWQPVLMGQATERPSRISSSAGEGLGMYNSSPG
jgi:hypothetical protein